MKKIIALACALVMMVSMFAITSNAAVDGAEVILEFAGYETAGATTFAKVNVIVNIPDTLVPYAEIEPDWENTFEYEYKGKMLQSIGIDVPYVDGLQFIKAKSTMNDAALASAGVALNANATAATAQVAGVQTSSDKSLYYAGSLGNIATLYYRITGDVNGTYELTASNAVVGLGNVDAAAGTFAPYEYKFADFTITNAVIKPAEPEFEPSTEKGALVEGTDDIVLEKDPAGAYKNTFLGTALFEATLGADVNYSEAGFIWVKDDVETANKYTVDASVIAGGGTFEYGVAMYGIPAGVDIDAIPYYVTAE